MRKAFGAIAALALIAFPASAGAWPQVCAERGEGLVFSLWFKSDQPSVIVIRRMGDDWPSMVFSNAYGGFGSFSQAMAQWLNANPFMRFMFQSNPWLSQNPVFGMGGMSGMGMGMGMGMDGMGMGMGGNTAPLVSAKATGSWQTSLHERQTCYLVLSRYSEDKGYEWKQSAYRFEGPIADFSGAQGQQGAVRVVVSSSTGQTTFRH